MEIRAWPARFTSERYIGAMVLNQRSVPENKPFSDLSSL